MTEMEVKSAKITLFIRSIVRFYHWWALRVADHAILIIAICTTLSLLGTAKIANTPNENDITGYTPYGARARGELDVATEFLSRGGSGITVLLLILPRDGGNALRLDVLKEALKVEQILSSNFIMLNPRTNKNESYREFCFNFCQINQPFVQFAVSSCLTLFNYSVELRCRPLFSVLRSSWPFVSFMLALHLRGERKDGWTTQRIKDFELNITLEDIIFRLQPFLLPFLVVGFAIMVCVSSLTTFLSAFFMDQANIHKFSLAITACICPFMACGTALGGLFCLGLRFGSILCVTPFLVLAIGVDDAYLMIHSWQRVTKKLRQNPVKEDCAAYRLAQVLSETGPAIMISALTNISADGVGAFTSSPEITLLCYGNAASIFVDFIYQITFYSAVMVLVGHFELENEHKNSLTQKIECIGDRFDRLSSHLSTFLDQYVEMVTNKTFYLTFIFVWIAFLGISIKISTGIMQMPINLTPRKLFTSDSPLREMDHLRVSFVIPEFTYATSFVNKPGNLSDQSRLERLNSFVTELESLPGSWGKQSTNYFIRDFADYEKGMSELETEEGTFARGNSSDPHTLNFNDLPSFLEWPEYKYWRAFSKNMFSFFKTFYCLYFLISVHEFNTTVYYDDGIYLDLIENMPTDTWQSCTATICCMAIVCFIFMCDFFPVVITVGVITSIMIGILGILSWTGTELDPIVMAALIISIGFSVDIPAHVSFHYHSAGNNKSLRLRFCLSSVGLPALQASLSTSLCVLSLLMVTIYMSQAFVKTMILCVVLCVIHSLLFIPCLISAVDSLSSMLRHFKRP
uniref:SSD domain-containing protein n=1 Tax=Angiostrongylus cantonensis TaxID=6313 RepID=A0A158PAF3_ANGCA